MGDRFFRAFLSEEILSGEGFKSFAEELGMTSGQLQINHSMPRPVMNLELVDDNEIYDRVEIATVSRSHSLSAQTIGGGEQSLCVMSPATAFTGAFARKLSDYPTFKYAYCGLWEDERWQNEHDITQFEGSGRPHEHLPKVDKGGPWGVCIDTSHNPGRRIIATGHIIQSTWRMWFGEAVSFFLPKERLLRFSHASGPSSRTLSAESRTPWAKATPGETGQDAPAAPRSGFRVNGIRPDFGPSGIKERFSFLNSRLAEARVSPSRRMLTSSR